MKHSIAHSDAGGAVADHIAVWRAPRWARASALCIALAGSMPLALFCRAPAALVPGPLYGPRGLAVQASVAACAYVGALALCYTLRSRITLTRHEVIVRNALATYVIPLAAIREAAVEAEGLVIVERGNRTTRVGAAPQSLRELLHGRAPRCEEIKRVILDAVERDAADR